MKGSWKGSYTYNSVVLQKVLGFPKTYFEIDISEVIGNQFKGKVRDDLETGGTPGEGDISGVITNDEVSFIKMMPKRASIDLMGNIKVEKGKHPNLYYQGTFTDDHKRIEGTWRFKFGVMMSGFIPTIVLPMKGKFVMQKQ